MADYFTKFSVHADLPTEAARTYALELAEEAAGHFLREEPLSTDFPAQLLHALEDASDDFVDWGFATEKTSEGVWIHADYGGGGAEVACLFIQHLLQKFNPDDTVTFEWSRDCSQPRDDAYGGGAAVITAREIKTMSTSKWLRDQSPVGQ